MPLADVDGDVGSEILAFARHGDVGVGRVFKVLRYDARQIFFNMATQCVADIDLLAIHGKLHGRISPYVDLVCLAGRLNAAHQSRSGNIVMLQIRVNNRKKKLTYCVSGASRICINVVLQNAPNP